MNEGISGKIANLFINSKLTILLMVTEVHSYPDSLGYENDFVAILREWRPHLLQNAVLS